MAKQIPSAGTNRPPATARDVVAWFSAIQRGPKPDESMVDALVHCVNLGLPTYLNKQPPSEVARASKMNTEELRLSAALNTLHELLPRMTTTWNEREQGPCNGIRRSGTLAEQAARLRALQMAVEAAGKSFAWTPKLSTSDRGNWHNTAILLGKLVEGIMLQAGHIRVTFSKHNGPAVRIVQQAMAYVEGFEREGTALVSALQKLR